MVRFVVVDLIIEVIRRRSNAILSELFTEVESREEDEQSKKNEVKDCNECVDLMPNKFVVLLLLCCFLGHADHF